MYSPCDNDPSECSGDVPAANGTCLQIVSETGPACVLDTDCAVGQVCNNNSQCADILDAYCSINDCSNPALDCEPAPGSAPVICLQTFCALDCTSATCPTGMTCYNVGGSDNICA
jgi:hypothetical protein